MAQAPGKKIILAITVIAAIPLISFLLWFFSEKKPFDIIIVNKSAYSVSRFENKSAIGILHHNRFVKKDGKAYNRKRDYYGFFPSEPYDEKQYYVREITGNNADSLAGNYDMAWFIDSYGFVDSYGLTVGDWYGDGASDHEHSEILYGGLSQHDYRLLHEMITNDKLVLAEFNFFASPTPENVRKMTEKLIDIYWSGWTGMYYDDLDYRTNKYLPVWILEAYREQNNNYWPYTESGIVLVHEDGSVLVLENETHLDIEVPLITTSPEEAAMYGVSEQVHYPYRFDISYAADTTSVISFYELCVNEKGRQLLVSRNIPSRFPAVSGKPGKNNFYYLAGNFSFYEMPAFTTMMRGVRAIDFFLYTDEIESRDKFFWKYYYPLVTNIVLDYYNTTSE